MSEDVDRLADQIASTLVERGYSKAKKDRPFASAHKFPVRSPRHYCDEPVEQAILKVLAEKVFFRLPSG